MFNLCIDILVFGIVSYAIVLTVVTAFVCSKDKEFCKTFNKSKLGKLINKIKRNGVQ
jgi:hypothetical protein